MEDNLTFKVLSVDDHIWNNGYEVHLYDFSRSVSSALYRELLANRKEKGVDRFDLWAKDRWF